MFIVQVRLREVDLREGDEVDRLGKEADLLDEEEGNDLQLEGRPVDADVHRRNDQPPRDWVGAQEPPRIWRGPRFDAFSW